MSGARARLLGGVKRHHLEKKPRRSVVSQRGVLSGTIRGSETSSVCGRDQSAGSSETIWHGTKDSAQDAGLLRAAWLSTKTVGKRPKLDVFLGVIDQILEQDKQQIRKQRHTAKRIFERLKQEHGYEGGYTVVKDYVREQTLRQKEMFVPLGHPPGDAQVDFGEADIIRCGRVERAHFFVMDLPHSDDAFVMAFPAETTEAFLEGHNQAFAYFGGVAKNIVYDNTKIAVAKILGDGTRRRTQAFDELLSHYLFQERFGRPGRGNDKGKVEGLVGYSRRNF